MKMQTVTVSGWYGQEQRQLPADGEKVKVNRDAHHGDWKTAMVRPGAWPVIPKGTEVEVVGWMQNLEGVHMRVKYLEWTYDIPTHQFENLR